MPTTKRYPDRRPQALHEKLGKDSSTLLNPYARPGGRAAKGAVAGELPEIVDHTGDCAICGVRHEVCYAEGRGEEFSADNPLAWRLFYRNEYASGRVDSFCRYQWVIAPTAEHGGRERALLTLLTLRRGLCKRLHLFRIDPPASQEQRAEADQANRIVQRWRQDHEPR